jgi:23S rRNA (pseudouridine1915-N3)-methyltransferase
MKQGPERELLLRYVERATTSGRALGLSGFEINELAESRAPTPQKRKSDEAAAITQALGTADLVVALDERGKTMGSEDFAKRIGRWRDDGKSGLAFVIGGPDGLDPDLVKRAALSLSFSPLTWPHQLVRVMLAEQLYRATTILAGHPYHRE